MTNFSSNGENLLFKEIPHTEKIEGIAYGIFREDGTPLGRSICRNNRLKTRVWYLSDIFIELQFRGKGYGSLLLEKTCEALWQKEKLPILLERPSDAIAPNGFDRKAWYQEHGFTSHPNPEKTFMWRDPPQ